MTRFARLLIGSALTSLIASHGFAADAVPEASQPASESQLSAAAAPAPAAPATTTGQAATDKPRQADTSGKATAKIGYISMTKVAAESAEGKAATGKLKAKSGKLRAKLEARQKQLEKEQSAIEAKLGTMTPKERAAKGSEFQKKMEDFQKLVRSSELEIADLQDKLTAEMYANIKKVAAEYAKTNGYAILIEERSVLYVTDEVIPKDLTAEIIDLLNKTKAK